MGTCALQQNHFRSTSTNHYTFQNWEVKIICGSYVSSSISQAVDDLNSPKRHALMSGVYPRLYLHPLRGSWGYLRMVRGCLKIPALAYNSLLWSYFELLNEIFVADSLFLILINICSGHNSTRPWFVRIPSRNDLKYHRIPRRVQLIIDFTAFEIRSRQSSCVRRYARCELLDGREAR